MTKPGIPAVPMHRLTGALARISLIALAVFGFVAARPATAQQTTSTAEFQTKARQAILIDADSGAVLFQHKADELMSPASMSKLMTLHVLFKALQDGQVKPTDEFTLSEHGWRKGGGVSQTSAMLVPLRGRARIEELIQGIIVQSGNDAAIMVAEGLAGSEEAFAKVMTDEARRLGMSKSVFKNATGLYDPEHLTTARDMATLARHIIKTHSAYYPIFVQRDFRYLKHKFTNRNPLIFLNIGADGLKTGFIKESGYGITASAIRDGRRLILVINGLTTANERRDEAVRLFDWGFRSFAEFKLFDAGEIVGRARVYGGESLYVPLVGNGDVAVMLPRFAVGQRLKAEIVYQGPLKTPIRKGDQVAALRVTTSANATNEVPLFAAEDVKPAGMMWRGLDSLAHMAFRLLPGN